MSRVPVNNLYLIYTQTKEKIDIKLSVDKSTEQLLKTQKCQFFKSSKITKSEN